MYIVDLVLLVVPHQRRHNLLRVQIHVVHHSFGMNCSETYQIVFFWGDIQRDDCERDVSCCGISPLICWMTHPMIQVQIIGAGMLVCDPLRDYEISPTYQAHQDLK